MTLNLFCNNDVSWNKRRDEGKRVLSLTVVRVYGAFGKLAVPVKLKSGRIGMARSVTTDATLTCDPSGATYIARDDETGCVEMWPMTCG